jgi:ribonucleoside-diphosphate reductase beta chain
VIAGYEHFAGLASRLQWDEAAIDLRPDAGAWPGLDAPTRERLLALLAGFCVGEASVADELRPFADAADDPHAQACFLAQEGDERRHAAFFDRVMRDVCAVPGADAARRRDAARGLVPAGFLELFDERLPAVARDLGAGGTDLGRAVGLYHMVLEGVVFTAGQMAVLDLLEERPELPGIRAGVELVLRDERWHVGFGTRCLDDAAPAPEALEAVVREGTAAARVWQDVVGEALAAKVVAMLHRRLSAVRPDVRQFIDDRQCKVAAN